ncbi:MAG: PAS domain S-box protein, partial [Dehalococcoidia bacterium]
MVDKARTKKERSGKPAILRRPTAELEASEGESESAEKAQQNSEERYRLLFEQSRDAMFITSVEGKVVEVNEATLDIFGYTREEAMKLPVLDAYAHPEDRERFQQELQKGGSARDYDVTLLKKNGAKMDCLVSATVWRAKDGSILGYQGIIRDITKHKRMEEALKASEAKFRRLFENMPDGVFQSTPSGKTISANPALVQMLGYDSEEELRALDLARDVYVNPEDREMLNRKLADEGRVGNFELKLKRKDGQQVIVLANSHTVRDEGGRVLYYEGTATDITERKRAEEAHRESEARYRNLFDTSKDAIYITTREGQFVDVNQATLDLFGYSRKEMMKLNTTQVYADPEDLVGFHREIDERGSVRDFEERFRRADGMELICLVTATVRLASDRSIIGYQGIIRDITERKRMEEALRSSEAKFRGLFENLPEGVYQCKPYGNFIAANPAFVQLLGYESEEELLGVSGRNMWANPEDRDPYFQHLKEKGELRNIELTLKRKDGQHVTVLENDRLVRDEKGQILYIEGALTDITERKRAEEALRASEAKFRGLIENLLEGVYQSSPDGRQLTANPAFVRMMGYESEEELLAVDARERWANLEDRDRWIQQLEEYGELRNIELVLKRKDGQHITVLENDRAVRDEQGRLLYREGVVTDITDRKRAEEAMIRQTRELAVLEERNRMAREIHDGLAQGFTGVVLQLEAAEQALDLQPGEVSNHLNRAKDLARRCLEE